VNLSLRVASDSGGVAKHGMEMAWVDLSVHACEDAIWGAQKRTAARAWLVEHFYEPQWSCSYQIYLTARGFSS
jgi:hypothetical protein